MTARDRFAAWLLCLPAALLLPAVLMAAGPTTSAADADWRDYQAALNARPQTPLSDLPPLEREQAYERHYLELRTRALTFLDRNPTDPRRWPIVLQLNPAAPRFVLEWRTDARGQPEAVVDEAAARTWRTRVSALKAAMADAADVPDEVRRQLAWEQALHPFTAAAAAQRSGARVDLGDLRSRLDAYARVNPDAAGGATLARHYVGLVERDTPERVDEEWGALARSPNRPIARLAAEKARAAALLREPLELNFNAADGRAVDLASLRGKVVLVDFWATWCVPCLAELPSIRKVYADYHDRGFEVIGISLESVRHAATDTPAQRESKLVAAREAFVAFTAKNGMPWPHYFDGEGWQNPIARRHAVDAIPAMLLLGPDGRVVSRNARGDALEREVRRLLEP